MFHPGKNVFRSHPAIRMSSYNGTSWSTLDKMFFTVYSGKYKRRWDHVSSCTNSTTKCDKLTSLCQNNSTDLLNTGCSNNFSRFLYCGAASLINVLNLVWCKSIPLQNRFIFVIKSINIMSVETSSTTK